MVFRVPKLHPNALVAISFLMLLVFAPACGSSSTTSSTAGVADSLSGSLTVSAASSLQGAFTDIKAAFQKMHPDVNVTINFAASSTLSQQIIAGAPVDVFAAADEATMINVSDAKLLSGTPTLFASNSLEIIVRRGNPSKIATLSDLSKSGLIYVTCAPAVPIGRYSSQVLQKAGVTVTPASLEPDVKGIVAKILAGEADAGIVYSTDVRATDDAAQGVVIPADINVVAKYPIAAIAGSGKTTSAEAWIAFVTGTAGQSILKSYGFTSP